MSKTNASDLSRDELAKLFSMPIADAAKQIHVCATVLKKVCRKYVAISS